MSESFQNEIPRARVNIKLDLVTGGAQKKVELPLKLLSVGDFSNGKTQGTLTGLVNTSSGSVLASSGGEAQSPQVMQVSAGTATGFVSYPSPFPGGTFGRGADGRYVGAGTTSTGLSGNKGVCIVYEYS